jgi:hypothetical protein
MADCDCEAHDGYHYASAKKAETAQELKPPLWGGRRIIVAQNAEVTDLNRMQIGSETERGFGPQLRLWAAAIAIVAVAVRLLILVRTHSTGEDALITLRYAENLAHGKGLVFNPGESVLGVTTPLYCLLISLFAWLHLPALLCGKILCIAADGLTCYLISHILFYYNRPAAGLAASALYALTTTPISVTISGMETGLVTCVGLCMVWCMITGRTKRLWALGAVLYLLRIDGLLLLLFLAYDVCIYTRRIDWKAIGIFVAVALPWTLFAWHQYGTPVPTSLIAKITVYRHPSFSPQVRWHGLRITPTNAEAFASQFIAGSIQKLMTLLFVLGAALAAHRRTKDAAFGRMKAPAAWCIVYYAVMLTSRVPAFPWYFLPPWPLFTIVACYAGDMLLRRVPVSRHLMGLPVYLPALCAMLLGAAHLPAVVRQVTSSQRLEDQLRRPIGEWLGAHMAPEQKVMLEPIGYIGYYSGARVLDSIGLVSPEVLPSYRDLSTKDPRTDIIHRLRPEWLCLRSSEVTSLRAADAAILDHEYNERIRFSTPGAETFTVYCRADLQKHRTAK